MNQQRVIDLWVLGYLKTFYRSLDSFLLQSVDRDSFDIRREKRVETAFGRDFNLDDFKFPDVLN